MPRKKEKQSTKENTKEKKSGEQPKEKPIQEELKQPTVKIKSVLLQERIVTEDSDEARELYNQGRYGIIENGKVYLSLIEGLYLMEKGKLDVFDKKNHNIISEQFIKKAQRKQPNFWVRYVVYRDIRNRGYIIKTALKFGADFRVYDRGIKPGDDHAKWVVFPVDEASTLTWYEFSSKNRVAHSTKKRLLVGCVDAENDVTYYEIAWKRP
ncbi:tRNA-intron lyase [Candidatus Woesearchaeota archaeon]|nr:tRNA-intron lyase [Candidatus Woesearchaeota archaeon]